MALAKLLRLLQSPSFCDSSFSLPSLLSFFFFFFCCFYYLFYCCFAPTEHLSTSARLPAAAAGPAPRLGLGWGSPAGSLPLQRAQSSHGAAAPNLEGSCQMGFSPCQEHVWVHRDPLPEPLRSIWQDKLQGCCDHHHPAMPGTGLSLCLGFCPS